MVFIPDFRLRCPTNRPAFALDQAIHVLGDLAVTFPGGVLVDQRCPLTRMAHPVHQLASARPGARREMVSGMPKIMEVEFLG
jgi:hypothetical protein